MADISLMQDEGMDDADKGAYDQGEASSSIVIDMETLLTPLQRVQKYSQSPHVYDRQMVAGVVLGLFRAAPVDQLAEDYPKIMEIITELAEKDVAMVRTDLLEEVPNLVTEALEWSFRLPALNSIVSEYLLPLVVQNLGNTDAARSALFHLLEQELITKQQAEELVCPTILALLNTDGLADSNTGIVMLMIKLMPLLGPDITERVFLKKFAELSSNELFYIRRLCAAHFGQMCNLVGKDAFEQILLPAYIKLCNDDIWGVRKECAEIILSVSCACSPNIRRTKLTPVYARLLRDETKWVKLAAFQSLGPFISTFADPSTVNLSYNKSGELVMVNSNGNEFRLSSPSGRSVSANEYRHVFDLGINSTTEQERNPMENGNVIIKFENMDTPPLIENKKEDVIIQKNFGVISKALYGKVIEATSEIDLSDRDETGIVVEQGEDIQEIVETVKNAVLFSSETCEAHSTNGIIEPHANSCDKDKSSKIDDISDILKELSLETDGSMETNSDNIRVKDEKPEANSTNANANFSDCKKHTDDDNLEKYNSYTYWRINPELPLDPLILNGLLAEKEEVGIEPTIGSLETTFTLAFDEGCHFDTYNRSYTFIEYDSSNDCIDSVPRILIDHFTSMTDLSLTQGPENELAYHCAYSLPAVALTLGKRNWHLLKPTVESLAADMQYKVRRTVACALHELAVILGPDVASSSLMDIFDGFVKDLDEVRVEVLNNLAKFLRVIEPAQRSAYLPRLADFLQTDNEWNWRFRQELARQLLMAVPLFTPGDVAKHLASIAHELLCDKVAAVRQVALQFTTQIVKHISADQQLTSRLLIKLAETFAHSKKWKRRQTFALLCAEFLSAEAVPPELFASDVMPHLLDLSWDPVANVRLVVARTIANHIIINEYFTDPNNQQYDGLDTVLRRLQTDKDRDVRQSAILKQYTNPLV